MIAPDFRRSAPDPGHSIHECPGSAPHLAKARQTTIALSNDFVCGPGARPCTIFATHCWIGTTPRQRPFHQLRHCKPSMVAWRLAAARSMTHCRRPPIREQDLQSLPRGGLAGTRGRRGEDKWTCRKRMSILPAGFGAGLSIPWTPSTELPRIERLHRSGT